MDSSAESKLSNPDSMHPSSISIPFSETPKETDTNALLQDSDSLCYENGRRCSLSAKVLIPALIVVFASAGFAVGFVAWLYVHRWQSSLKEVWREGAFLIIEGTKREGTGYTSRLMGLTISAAATQQEKAVGFNISIIMSVYAFRSAQFWFRGSKNGQRDWGDFPTPIQYGLLVELLSSIGFLSLLNASRYFIRGRRNEFRIPPMLTEAFAIGLVVYVLAHAVSGADLWLHATTRAVERSQNTTCDGPGISNFIRGGCNASAEEIAANPAAPVLQCFWDRFGSSDTSDRSFGMNVALNNSAALRAITLADSSDLAILTNMTVPLNSNFQMTTFGANATCQIQNDKCSLENNGTTYKCGPPVPQSFVCNVTGNECGFPGSAIMLKLSSNGNGYPYFNESRIISNGSQLLISGPGSVLESRNATLGPYGFWFQFVWAGLGTRTGPGSALVKYNDYVTMLVQCHLGFHSVTVNYEEGKYELVTMHSLDSRTSDMFSMPVRIGYESAALMDNIQAFAFSSNNSDVPLAYLRQEFARFAIGSAAGMISSAGAPIQRTCAVTFLLGQYRIRPVIFLVAVLLANSVVALVIFVATALARADRIRVPHERESVSALELAQLRLASPLAVASELFRAMDGIDIDRNAALSAKEDPEDMYDEETDKLERVGIGLDDNDRGVFRLRRAQHQPQPH